MAHMERVIILIDMDCFYCQVEEQLDPNLKDKPIAVVQYNAWRGGGIIAVNYPARDLGVTRHMRGNDAKMKCPDIELVRVPQVRGKADLTKYREAGKQVAEVLQSFTSLLERASVDEAYLDITEAAEQRMKDNPDLIINVTDIPNTYIVGSSSEDFLVNSFEGQDFTISNMKLAFGAVIAEEIRAEVFRKTGYKCSAGIAHNKILAKLVCGLHKPNKQTLLPHDAVAELYLTLPVKKIKSLGGKFGNTIEEVLGIKCMGELLKFSEKQLIQKFDEKTGTWLYKIARGIDLDPVTVRLISKSIGCCKKFPGRTALTSAKDVEHWINELAQEIAERLDKDIEENNRRAKQMVVSFAQEVKGNDVSSSRTHPLNSYEQNKIAQNALNVIRRFCMRADGSFRILFLGISVGNFEDIKKVKEITSFFKSTEKTVNTGQLLITKPHANLISEQFLPSESRYSIMNFFQKETDSSKNSSSYQGLKVVSSDKKENIGGSPVLNEEIKETAVSTFQENFDLSAEKDNSSSSIWSQETIELNNDHKELIFYDTKKEEIQGDINTLVRAQRILGESSVSEDSISDEIISSNSTLGVEKCQKVPTPESGSFFERYFSSVEERQMCKSPVQRDFNTSKVLDLELETSTEDDNDRQICEDIVNNSNDSNNDAEILLGGEKDDNLINNQLGTIDTNSDDTMEKCIYCEKAIPKCDIVSHMDYHYALQIVKEESTLYKQNTKTKPALHLKNKKSSKRKSNVKITSIKSFLKTESVPIEESDICAECDRRVRYSELESHMDYHAAKKLHMEINSGNSSTPINIQSSSKDVKKKINSARSISSFFKPL